jgi:hypothetical protein
MEYAKESYPTANDVDTRPDFGRILETLQKEASFSTELSEAAFRVANGLKSIEMLVEKNPELKQKEPNCLVDYLWETIWKIQRANSQMEKTITHLQRVIGS